MAIFSLTLKDERQLHRLFRQDKHKMAIWHALYFAALLALGMSPQTAEGASQKKEFATRHGIEIITA